MRFETSILTLGEPVHYGLRFFRAAPHHPNDKACLGEIQRRGWLIPNRTGTRIVLVFSTTRVVGASRCLTSDLVYAGARAMERDGTVYYQPLWWWPEIVTGGAGV